jgi:cytoskeletal protein CcmA (bactofilin family)
MGKNPKLEPIGNENRALAQQPTYNMPAQNMAPSYPSYPEAPVRLEIGSPSTTRAVMETESLAREIKDGTMSGFVGDGTALSGEVVFKGMLRVDGHLTGRISSEKGTLIVSSGGRVEAHINVATAKINGIINGDVVATERIEFGRTAQVYGDIQTPVLIIEQGALFEGNCRMNTVKATDEKEGTEKSDKKYSGRTNLPQLISDKNPVTEVLESSNVTS